MGKTTAPGARFGDSESVAFVDDQFRWIGNHGGVREERLKFGDEGGQGHDGISWLIGGADGADERLDFFGGLFPQRGFDAAADIDGKGMQKRTTSPTLAGVSPPAAMIGGKLAKLPAACIAARPCEIVGDAGAAANGPSGGGFQHAGRSGWSVADRELHRARI